MPCAELTSPRTIHSIHTSKSGLPAPVAGSVVYTGFITASTNLSRKPVARAPLTQILIPVIHCDCSEHISVLCTAQQNSARINHHFSLLIHFNWGIKEAVIRASIGRADLSLGEVGLALCQLAQCPQVSEKGNFSEFPPAPVLSHR